LLATSSSSSNQLLNTKVIDSGNTVKKRMKFSKEQIKVLEATFNENNYPDVVILHELINKLELPMKRVIVWFQNRRAKLKREKIEKISEKKRFNVPLTINYSSNQFTPYQNNIYNNSNGLLTIAQPTIIQNLQDFPPVYFNQYHKNHQVNHFAPPQNDTTSSLYYSFSQISTPSTEPYYYSENSYGTYNTYYNQ
jgi:hypothetical protein